VKKSLLDYCVNFSILEESKIYDNANRAIGWHSSALDKSGHAISSGTSSSREIAKRIAVSELFERSIINYLSTTEEKEDYSLTDFPSSSGFAFGFEKYSTMYRSIAEACERWAWSKWIDNGFHLEDYYLNVDKLSHLSRFYYDHFDEVKCFYKKFEVDVNGKMIPLHFGVTVGIKEKGVFPGSRVASLNEDIFEHGLLEAYRHLKIFENSLKNQDYEDIVSKRINFFGSNKEIALHQIFQSQKKAKWPIPKLRILKNIPLDTEEGFLWRSLCHDFIGWHEGTKERFVY
jgi:hypothetical protein